MKMKKLLILLFSILISFNSYGEWTKIAESNFGDTYYVDYETIKKNNEYLYYWQLDDYLEPLSDADGPKFSSILMYKVDCDSLSYKRLTATFYSGQMGKGTSKTISIDDDWLNTPSGSGGTLIRNELCLSY